MAIINTVNISAIIHEDIDLRACNNDKDNMFFFSSFSYYLQKIIDISWSFLSTPHHLVNLNLACRQLRDHATKVMI
jgi:hypothetical protein